jgi:hypothetical protein
MTRADRNIMAVCLAGALASAKCNGGDMMFICSQNKRGQFSDIAPPLFERRRTLGAI